MVQPVAVVFVHGINTFEPGYEAAMQAAIRERLPEAVRDLVTFKAVFWAKRVRERQQQYLDAVARNRLFDVSKWRRLVLQGLGDAAAYQKTRSYKNSAYFGIQADVRAVLEDLDRDGLPERPLIFIGHSLGCHIISSFAWDINTIKHWNHGRAADEGADALEFVAYLKDGSPFRRLDTLAGLIMMGSNMPLFTFTFGPDKVYPISHVRGDLETPAFPGKALDDATLGRARWLNFYSRNDLFGYPLKPLNDAYANEPRLSDIEVRSEGLRLRLLSYLFAPVAAYRAHIGYWTHKAVVRGAADLIISIATAREPPVARRWYQFWRS